MSLWSKAEESRLRQLYPESRTRDLVALFAGKSFSSIRSRARLLNLHKSVGFGAHLEWSFANDYILRMYYPHVKTAVIAARVGASVFSTYNRAKKLALTKTAVYMASPDACRLRREMSCGTRYRFSKGHVPANKGLRRPGWSTGRMRETQFKKGQLSGAAKNNLCPVGTERMNADGYMRLKVSDLPESIAGKGALNKNWVFVHHLVWEQANGPIPKGYRIWWKDGDRRNNSLANLELLSGADHMARTTIHNLPPDIREVIHLRGAINRTITWRTQREEQSQRSA